MLYEVLLVCYLIVAICLIGFVLIQQGKGADMGASFGAGGSNTIFGSSGSGNFMTRTTAILATLFFTISLIIGGITADNTKEVDEFENIESQAPVQPQSLEANEFSIGEDDVQSVVDDIANDVETSEEPKEDDQP